jgi:hypothetical protein
VVITCSTQQPYRHCLEVPSSSQAVEVTVQGIHFEHYSKSVANNYCIFAQVCKVLPCSYGAAAVTAAPVRPL